jgi:hypothetical protein
MTRKQFSIAFRTISAFNLAAIAAISVMHISDISLRQIVRMGIALMMTITSPTCPHNHNGQETEEDSDNGWRSGMAHDVASLCTYSGCRFSSPSDGAGGG